MYTRGIDYLGQADHVYVAHLFDHNDGYHYLLNVIEIF